MRCDIEKIYELIVTLKINKVEVEVEAPLSSAEIIGNSIVALKNCQVIVYSNGFSIHRGDKS